MYYTENVKCFLLKCWHHFKLQINEAQHHVTVLEAEKRVLQGRLHELNSPDEGHDLEEKLVSQSLKASGSNAYTILVNFFFVGSY